MLKYKTIKKTIHSIKTYFPPPTSGRPQREENAPTLEHFGSDSPPRVQITGWPFAGWLLTRVRCTGECLQHVTTTISCEPIQRIRPAMTFAQPFHRGPETNEDIPLMASPKPEFRMVKVHGNTSQAWQGAMCLINSPLEFFTSCRGVILLNGLSLPFVSAFFIAEFK